MKLRVTGLAILLLMFSFSAPPAGGTTGARQYQGSAA